MKVEEIMKGSGFDSDMLERVIRISKMNLATTIGENNYWRNLIQKSTTDEPFSVREAFELGRFSERMFNKACEIMRKNNGHIHASRYIDNYLEENYVTLLDEDEVRKDYLATVGYTQFLQSKFTSVKTD